MSNGLVALVVLVVLVVGWAVSVFNRLVRSRNQMNNAFAQIDVQLKRRHDLIPNLVNTARGYLQHERQTLQGVTLARQRASDARQALAASFGGHASTRASNGLSAAASAASSGAASSGSPDGGAGGLPRAPPARASSASPSGMSSGAPGRAPGAAAGGVRVGAPDEAADSSSGAPSDKRRGRLELLEALDRAESGLNTALGKFAMVVEAYPELKADQTLMQLNEELASTENRIGFSRQAFNDAVTSHNDTLGQFPSSLVATACGFTVAGQLRSTTRSGERAPATVRLP